MRDGADNAVRSCLGLSEGERFELIVEVGQELLASHLEAVALEVGADVNRTDVKREDALDDAFVDALCRRLATAQASVFLGSFSLLPVAFRRRVVEAGAGGRRHAHMLGVDRDIMRQSMLADYAEVHRLGETLQSILAPGGVLSIQTKRGTDLHVQVGQHRWHNASGVLRTPGWTNLPGGELYTTPTSVDGVLIPDAGVWGVDGRHMEHSDRLKLTFEEGVLVDVEGRLGADAEGLLSSLRGHANATRVGQVGFGTNLGIVALVKNLLQDLKMPGVHLSLGHTAPEETGATWDSPVEVPLLIRRATVEFEGRKLLREGRYARDIRRSTTSFPPPGR